MKKNKVLISDFDGTITKSDTINLFFEIYANSEWLRIEKDWIDGKIGSDECLKGQMDCVRNIREKEILEFLDTIEIDDYFYEFYRLAKEQDLEIVIASDGFDYFINRILEKNKIYDIDVYTNALRIKEDNLNKKFELLFPNNSKVCKQKAGTCKCEIVKKYKNIYKDVFYVGDGVSDYCVANKVDFLFAKKKLSEYCEQKGVNYTKYTTFKEVIANDRLGFDVRFRN